MTKTCHPNAFNTQDQSHYVHQTYTIIMEAGVTFDDLFAPGFWVHGRTKLRQRDLVRCVAQDGSFDVTLTVVAAPAGGVVMRFLSGDPGSNIDDPLVAAAEARRAGTQIRPVPLDAEGNPVVRVQFLPATKWRVLGIDGKEVDRNFATQHDAEQRMNAYLREIHMRLPTAEELQAAKAAKAEKTEASAS